MIYKLKVKQRGPYCSYCEKRATMRGCMFTKFSCDGHADFLYRDDEKENRPDYSEAAFIGRFR